MSEAPLQEAFDYDGLDEATREFVQRKTYETHGLMKRTAEHILQIGQNLLEVQQHLPEMKFSAWLRAEFALSRQTAYNFMKVATKFGGSCTTVLQLPAKILYELASSSQEIIQQVEKGEMPPTLDAIKAAKEAERQAREDQVRTQAHLVASQEQIQQKQEMIERLSTQIVQLQDRIAALSSAPEQIKLVVPPEVKAHVEQLESQVQTLKEQRDRLAQQVAQLGAEARAAACKAGEGEQERRIRLQWYQSTNAFRGYVTKLLSQWPSPLDTLAFEADDWTRLSQTMELARRLLQTCEVLTQARIVESPPISTTEEVQ